MKDNDFILKHNVELFSINLLVNRAKEASLKTVVIDSPVFKISYDDVGAVADFLSKSNKYRAVETNLGDRRGAQDPKGRYSEKTITLHWW